MKEQVKKWIIMIESLLLIFLIFFWCGTNMVSENGDHGEAAGTVEEAWRQDAKYLSVMAMEKEFFELIAGNPIDRTFEWKDVSTEDKIRQAVAYKELWEAEIEYTFDILEGYLSEQDFAILKQAHESVYGAYDGDRKEYLLSGDGVRHRRQPHLSSCDGNCWKENEALCNTVDGVGIFIYRRGRVLCGGGSEIGNR